MMMVLSIIGILSFLIVLVIIVYNMIKFNNLPVETCIAKVISKRRSRRGSNGGTSYYVVFEIGQRNVEMRTNSSIFHSLSEGMVGTLFYKSNVAVDFK